jgi:hypothetical protein
MFKMMVAPWRGASPYLGIGSYYLGTDTETASRHEPLVSVTLQSPLFLNGRQVHMLVQKYGTDSSDQMTALAGAWTLRREVLQKGHDGIIAVGSTLNDSVLTLVTLTRPTAAASAAPNG